MGTAVGTAVGVRVGVGGAGCGVGDAGRVGLDVGVGGVGCGVGDGDGVRVAAVVGLGVGVFGAASARAGAPRAAAPMKPRLSCLKKTRRLTAAEIRKKDCRRKCTKESNGHVSCTLNVAATEQIL